MKIISYDLGKLFFGRVFEISEEGGIGKKERFLKYRQILEDLFKELTKDENQFFSNLFARSEFIFKNYQTPPPVKKSIDSLRRLANKVVHNAGFEPTEKDESFSVRNLCVALSHFSGVPIPDTLKLSYEPHLRGFVETAKDQIKPSVKEKYSFYAVVVEVFPRQELAKNRVLVCENEDFGTFSLRLWNNVGEDGFGSDLTPFADLVWPFATIYVTEVKQHAERENEFYTTNRSLIVLEPDYLIEVKNLADCVQNNGMNPYVNLLARFSKGGVTDNLIVGNLVGSMLDDCSRETDYDYKRTFERYMRSNAFGMLVLANEEGVYNRDKITNIYASAKEHETNIKRLQSDRKTKKVYIEPTFISAQYGLLGRLDALYEDPSNTNRKDVLELKSGSMPSQGLWKNHEAQTIGYDLLLNSVFPNRQGISSILYSKANGVEQQALRYVAGDHFLERQKLLMLRNQIVANEIKLSQGQTQPLKAIILNGGLPIPKYSEALIEEFSRIYANLNDLDQAYFEEYIRFVFKELRIAKMGAEEIQDSNRGFASLWKRTKTEKIEDYDALVYLTIESISENSVIELSFPEDSLFSFSISGLRNGDSVVLYPTPDPEELNPLRSQILKGTLREILTDRVVVSLINKQVDEQYFKSCKLWAVERDFRESSYRDMLLSLYQFIKSSPANRKLIFGKEAPKFEDFEFIPNSNLNENQNEIIQKALNAKDYFLIQGPPGTGKTSTVLKDIISRLNEQGEQIMVLAFTNRAVDEICRMLEKIPDLNFIRLGRGSEHYCWQSLSNELSLKELHSRVVGANVIVSTQSTFAVSMDILQVKNFDTLVVDEASQLLEPQLVGFLNNFNRFILIGDENQLPAVVLQDHFSSRTEKTTLHEIYLNNLRESLFSRLLMNAQKKNWDCYGMLTHHFRMHEDVADFINRAFYNSKLVVGLERQKMAIEDFEIDSENLIEQKLATNRVIFIPSKKEMRSKINQFEADIAKQVVDLIRQKWGEKFKLDETIGIITPFRAQMAMIKRLLPKDLHGLSVDTVERYQGSERDVIVLSFAVRSVAQLQAVESLAQNGVDRKLNVALSRARDFIIITGCEEILRKSGHIAALLDDIYSKGGYLEMPQGAPVKDEAFIETTDLF